MKGTLGMTIIRDPDQRLLSKFALGGPLECWLWHGHLTEKGYGAIWWENKMRSAHRLMWERARGPIPDGLVIDHLCRVRNCVNPSHMELVTAVENWRRGDSASAENFGKTHCKRGHEFTPENTRWFRGKNRQCITCKNAYDDARRRAAGMPIRKKAAA